MARVPLYKAAEDEMLRRIREGDWPVGLRLPNEFGLAEEFGVSQGTMRRALMTLEGLGYLSRKPGRGTIVANPQPVQAAAPLSPVQAALTDGDGAAPALTVYRARAGTRGSDPDEAALFGTGRLSCLDRTLKRDDTRIALDSVAIPEPRAPSIPETAPVDLPELLTELDLAPTRIEDRLSATVTTMAESVALSSDRYTGLLVLTRTAFDDGGRAIGRQVLRMIAADIGYAVTKPV